MKIAWAVPVMSMMLLSIIGIFIYVFACVHALRKGKISLHDFVIMDFRKDRAPWLEVTSRHLHDLFQTPVLFYVCAIIIISNEQLLQLPYLLVLGWLFVVFKIIHSIIHLTYNDFIQRLVAFLLANAFLFTLIVMLFIEVLEIW
ncbi:MAPEG family protein [Facilibium subflavum]|uniref:MAPEG family protein n=1 Tax=Facilibium subflavum TaxID=2219058 RepID=UPI000E64779D|nr:MAPEG family protein [Facilibium subflavum]